MRRRRRISRWVHGGDNGHPRWSGGNWGGEIASIIDGAIAHIPKPSPLSLGGLSDAVDDSEKNGASSHNKGGGGGRSGSSGTVNDSSDTVSDSSSGDDGSGGGSGSSGGGSSGSQSPSTNSWVTIMPSTSGTGAVNGQPTTAVTSSYEGVHATSTSGGSVTPVVQPTISSGSICLLFYLSQPQL
jgi:hypothetical protein